MLPGNFGNKMSRNQIANLTQDGELRGGWIDRFFLFFSSLPCGRAKNYSPAIFSFRYGMAVL